MLRQIGPGVPELWSDKQTDRQTEITILYILLWFICGTHRIGSDIRLEIIHMTVIQFIHKLWTNNFNSDIVLDIDFHNFKI